jgi:hypothetical protein
MAQITCALDQITNPAACNDRGGISRVVWFDVGTVDWDAMAADPTKFDPMTQRILGYTMIGGATMNAITFERKLAFYDFNYTRDDDFYTLLVTLGFKGKQYQLRNSLQSALACCNIGLHIYGNAGEQRVVGIDWDGEAFLNIAEQLAVTRHNDRGGQLGTSRAGDEIDLGGESVFAPLFADVAYSDLPLA